MRRRRLPEEDGFSLSFLDLLSCGMASNIILFVVLAGVGDRFSDADECFTAELRTGRHLSFIVIEDQGCWLTKPQHSYFDEAGTSHPWDSRLAAPPWAFRELAALPEFTKEMKTAHGLAIMASTERISLYNCGDARSVSVTIGISTCIYPDLNDQHPIHCRITRSSDDAPIATFVGRWLTAKTGGARARFQNSSKKHGWLLFQIQFSGDSSSIDSGGIANEAAN